MDAIAGKNILYVSVHEVLQDDEIKLFRSMGANCARLRGMTDIFRASTEDAYDVLINKKFATTGNQLTSEFFDEFDFVIVMHDIGWIKSNIKHIKKSRIILRTIGQYTSSHEDRISEIRQEISVVRYSPAESRLKRYAGADAIIRFYKDEDLLSGWSGTDKHILMFGNFLLRRFDHVNLPFALECLRPYDHKIYGRANEGLRGFLGLCPEDKMIDEYRNCRAYYSHHTVPASYTLSLIEAMMVGCPVITIGGEAYRKSKEVKISGEIGDIYEVPEIIINGKNGFACDTAEDAHRAIARLLSDFDYAKGISSAARETAIQLFSKQVATKAWRDFFNQLT